MRERAIELEWVDGGAYAVCRLEADDEVPAWVGEACGFTCVARSDRELSIVAPEGVVPDGMRAERGWALLRVRGTLDFGLTGILASITGALARDRIAVFAISTFDTDYLLVPASAKDRVEPALEGVATVVSVE